MQITEESREKLRAIVSHGLVSGLGQPKPGALCIEAAICLALGEPHGDQPTCVAAADRELAIRINDAAWLDAATRAEALLPIGLASLGTAGTDRAEWSRRVCEGTIRRIVPMALRAAAWVHPHLEHQAALIAAAAAYAADAADAAAAYAADAAAYAADAAAADADAADAAAARTFVLREFAAVVLDAYAAEGRA